ncbi:superoxide dismutase, Cu-Zn family [Tranquillimonas rosea]|uniref:Superoxide dismutase, Cu-Zn family n=1 Tax=Tranquillimonas rosea TaxID=641238 RepID=A0A1H9TQ01_9RHOB|nr:superoxide dismutase family protein [Tranquillimonas rosea]SER99232.1 superoxide dismutase, Cu-Zn family [Tranquillimonas rosea]
MFKPLATAALGFGLAATGAIAQDDGASTETAEQEMRSVEASVSDRDGNMLGTASLHETASGAVTVQLALENVPSGTHGVHLHETGDCSADDFTSAGGHVAGDAEHGVMSANGPHPGDLPNVVVGENGIVDVEYFNMRLDLDDHILDDDGAAFIMHDGEDDYMSQPAGDAGDRIGCGVFEQTEM